MPRRGCAGGWPPWNSVRALPAFAVETGHLSGCITLAGCRAFGHRSLDRSEVLWRKLYFACPQGFGQAVAAAGTRGSDHPVTYGADLRPGHRRQPAVARSLTQPLS